MTRSVPEAVVTFGREVVASLDGVLGDDLVGAYFVGSIALGGFVAGESDVDIVAVTERAVPDRLKPSIAAAVSGTTSSCPARGLEFTLYRRQVVASPPVAADFELNVNGGPRMERLIHLASRDEPGFWYVLDRAIAHRCGVAIRGPSPSALFAPIPAGCCSRR